jgi:hypothetical protein
MKKLFLNYNIIFGTITCFFITSCYNKKAEVKTTTKEHMDAGTKTIKNMQSAYKGEKTAFAKYEAFSKKAEEEGYHNNALLYNAVSAAENIHAITYNIITQNN